MKTLEKAQVKAISGGLGAGSIAGTTMGILVGASFIYALDSGLLLGQPRSKISDNISDVLKTIAVPAVVGLGIGVLVDLIKPTI